MSPFRPGSRSPELREFGDELFQTRLLLVTGAFEFGACRFDAVFENRAVQFVDMDGGFGKSVQPEGRISAKPPKTA